MSAASNFLEEAILNHVFRNISYPSPTNVYIGLMNDTATLADLEAGDLTNEITGYTGDRKVGSFTAPAQVDGAGQIENDVEYNFENMPEVTVGFLVLTDDPTPGVGNILNHSTPSIVKTANLGDTYQIKVGEFTIDYD